MEATNDIEFEIVPASTGLDQPAKQSLTEAFSGFFADAEKWKLATESIDDPKEAREARLELKRVRVAAEKTRKELKADSLRMGKAIDGANNILLSVIVPLEKAMDDIEKEEERRIAAELQLKTDKRLAELTPLLEEGSPTPDVRGWTDNQFARAVEDATLLRDARHAALKKLEDERVAKEKAEAEERERVRLENIKLKEEAEKREAEIKAEAEKRAKAEATERKKREAAEKKAAKARAEEEAKAKAEREAIEAEQKKERDRLQAEADAERQIREKVEAEAREKKAEEARRLEAIRLEEEAKAKAPDKEKLKVFADLVAGIEVPKFADSTLITDINNKLDGFVEWIETRATNL